MASSNFYQLLRDPVLQMAYSPSRQASELLCRWCNIAYRVVAIVNNAPRLLGDFYD